MAMASYGIPNVLGGELSAFAQGRFDKPDYRTSMKVCLNGLPTEIGTWTRRPGTMHGGTTRGGATAKVIKFDFKQATPYTLEFTDGKLRFRNGAALIPTADPQVVVAVSAANPAVVQTTSATTWATGDTIIFPGASTPLLENRQFLATKVDTTHFSLTDAITGATINGATLGALIAGATVARVQELATVYTGGSWANVRAVQAETTDILLNGLFAPQALTVPTLPTAGINAVFAIAPAIFNDGPYLDPFINGVQATPSAKSGIISLTLAFPAYSATTAYAAGAFVTSASINYISLADQNVNNTPAGSPLFWAVTSASAAINDGRGFLGTDVGRLVRLLSEPAMWLAGTTYIVGNVVAYNPSGAPGATTYWQSLTASNTGFAPGSDLTHWQLMPQNAAIWSWGKITSLSNTISGTLAGSTNIGNMTLSGGLAAAFDGVISKQATASAEAASAVFATSLVSYVGKNYSGATAQAISSVTIYPSTNLPLGFTDFSPSIVVTIDLRAKATAPASALDGTVLGTSTFYGNISGQPNTIAQIASAVSLTSSDQATLWNYVWVTIRTSTSGTPTHAPTIFNTAAQVVFFAPPGTGVTTGINVEILGPALLYTNPILTWRLGAYSNTTGWPTCGTYYEGRLWLAGAVANRFDASVSNGILGGTVNFSPTDQYGVVAPNNAISYTLNSDSVNPIFWMEPDLQGIIMGTQAGEYLVLAPTAGPIAPNNIAARRATKIGCANVEPRRTEHTSVIVQRYSRKLMEYFPDVYSGKFSAPNLADKAEHIVRSGVTELAYTSAGTPVIWGRCANGSLFGITYKRDTLASAQPPTFYGWHRHTLGSGRVVESICGGPSVGGDLDTLTMVTNDPATNIRHVELLTDAMDELTPLADAWFLDDAVTPSSTIVGSTGITLNGLWHLNGKTVQVFAGGLDCGDPGEGKPIVDFLVTNGSCVVPFGDSISAGSGRGLFTADFVATGVQIVVGLTYTSDGQLVRPILQADSGARSGPAFAKLSRGHRIGMQLVNTLGLSVGADFTKTMYPARFTKADGVTAIAQLTTYSGIFQDTLQDDYTYDAAPCWRITRPFPANVVAVGSNLATQDQ